MRCPYCVSDIADEALACPNCTRDLYLFKPLLERIAQLEKAVAEQGHSRVAASDARIAELEAAVARLSVTGSGSIAPAEPSRRSSPFPAGTVVGTMLAAVVLLLAAHWLLLFIYDVKPLYLRIATLLIPVPFGFLLGLRQSVGWRTAAVSGFVTGIAAVLAMLTLTAVIDRVPILPEGARDMRETFEYAAGIALAFITGYIIGAVLPAFRRQGSPPHRVAVMLSKALTPDEEGTLGVEKAAKKIDRVIKIATPAVTGIAAVYAGIKSLIDVFG
jgi:hypothetical protein